MIGQDALVRALVDLLVVPLERAPRVEVVPEVVEALDLLLGRGVGAERGDGLLLGEATLELKDGAEGGDCNRQVSACFVQSDGEKMTH